MTNRIELDDLLGNQADFEARYRRELASAEAELARNLPPANGIEVAPAIPGTVVTVGAGRGFVVTGRRDRLVITAAHCLTRKGEVSLPPPMNFSYTQERTYPTLLGPLGKKPTVWAECLFVDPISDIAVLGPPDDQALYDEYNAYETLMEEANDFPLTSAPMKGEAWTLSLKGMWKRCSVEHEFGVTLQITNGLFKGGMSGSPIVLGNGAAIGVVTMGAGRDKFDNFQPSLSAHLPGWLLADIRHRANTSIAE